MGGDPDAKGGMGKSRDRRKGKKRHPIMVELFFRFLKTPPELRGQAVVIQIEGAGIDRLRQYTQGHERERYTAKIAKANRRSLSQNDLFHAMAQALARASGYTLDEAKALLKHEGGVIYPYGPGFKPPTRPGRFVELYGEIEFQISTAHYTKAEFTSLIETTEQYLARAGIAWEQ
jgi:hypothetical protein